MELLSHPLLILQPQGFGALIRALGLPVVCAFVFLESGVFPMLPGDSLLVVCGMLAAAGGAGGPEIALWPLLTALPVCAAAGAQVGFGVGRWAGPRVYAWPDLGPAWAPLFRREWLRRTEAFFGRWGSFSVVAGRWVPFARTFTPLLAGVVRVGYAAFIPFNLLGSFTWVWTMVLAGYTLPPLIDRAHPGFRLEDHIDTMAAAVVALSLVPVVFVTLRERASRGVPPPPASVPAPRRRRRAPR